MLTQTNMSDYGQQMEDDVDVLRAFARTFAQRAGALDERFVDRGRAVGELRLLDAIGPEGAGVGALRDRLGLDSGYLSRLLRRLAGDGLVDVVTDPDDGRRRVARLTPAGCRQWSALDADADRWAQALLAPLGDRDRGRLRAALQSAACLLRAATVSFDVVDPASVDAVSTRRRYVEELDRRFGVSVHTSDGQDGDAPLHAPTGALVVLHDGADPVGCGGVRRLSPRVAEVKRMWVAPDWRGAGLGRRLLTDLEERAAAMGATHVRLDTHDTLTEAIALYERSGYVQVPPYNDNPEATRWYEKQLMQ